MGCRAVCSGFSEQELAAALAPRAAGTGDSISSHRGDLPPTPHPLLRVLARSAVVEAGNVALLDLTCKPQLPPTAPGQRCLSATYREGFAAQVRARVPLHWPGGLCIGRPQR